MALALWRLAVLLFPTIAILHLQVSPFTKVEESFNMQAIHDILKYGVPTNDAEYKFKTFFDHMTFPGAVPRTFIGALVLSGLAKPGLWISGSMGKASQFHIRAVLGGMNGIALYIFGRQVEKSFGPITALWYVVLQASQFHVWYYASRTLPNMFAFFLSTIAQAYLLPSPTSTMGPVRRTKLGLYLLTIATVIFRSELAILLATHCAWLFFKAQTFEGKVMLIRKAFIPSILPGAMLALLLTVSIDTYFWQSPVYLWPELSAFLSNVFPSKDSLGASAWGTQPWHWYFTSALPRLLMNQTFMVALFFVSPQTMLNSRTFDSLIPSIAYVGIYSILPHKETRFMFPIVPSLTLIAAITCTRLTINMHKSVLTRLVFYAAIASTIVTALISHAILLPLSAQNYPGGHALADLHIWYRANYPKMAPLHNDDPSYPQIRVHLTNLALQSGVTRFLEQPPPQLQSLPERHYHPLVTGSYHPDPDDEGPQPIVLPGDANHPALTIRPKPSASPSSPSKRSYANPIWIHDKTPVNDSTPSTFLSTFDFLIIEPPSTMQQPHLTGSWQTIRPITCLSLRPVSLPLPCPSNKTPLSDYRRYNPPFTSTLSEHLEYWTSWTPYEQLSSDEAFDPTTRQGGTTALLKRMYPDYLAIPLTRIHDLLHDILRLDLNLTRGRWIELPLVSRLVILRNCINSDSGCGNAVEYPQAIFETHQRGNVEDAILIDGTPSDSTAGKEAVGDWNTLGPLVVNKDGTLSRLENWAGMNAQERRRTVEYLRKRNLLRMEGAVDAEGTEGNGPRGAAL